MEGNQMKMREALEAIWKEVYFYAIEEDKQNFAHLQEAMLEDPPEYKDLRNSFLTIAHLVDAALSEPPRNCDVGTALEQSERFMDFCRPGNRPPNCEKCKVYPKRMNKFWCQLEWAQMPYAEEEGAVK